MVRLLGALAASLVRWVVVRVAVAAGVVTIGTALLVAVRVLVRLGSPLVLLEEVLGVEETAVSFLLSVLELMAVLLEASWVMAVWLLRCPL